MITLFDTAEDRCVVDGERSAATPCPLRFNAPAEFCALPKGHAGLCIRPRASPFDPNPRTLDKAQNGFIMCRVCDSVQPAAGHECDPRLIQYLKDVDFGVWHPDPGESVADAVRRMVRVIDEMDRFEDILGDTIISLETEEIRSAWHRQFDCVADYPSMIESIGSIACGWAFEMGRL